MEQLPEKEPVQRFGFRKLSVGLVSALVSSTMVTNAVNAHAETTSNVVSDTPDDKDDTSTSTDVETNSGIVVNKTDADSGKTETANLQDSTEQASSQEEMATENQEQSSEASNSTDPTEVSNGGEESAAVDDSQKQAEDSSNPDAENKPADEENKSAESSNTQSDAENKQTADDSEVNQPANGQATSETNAQSEQNGQEQVNNEANTDSNTTTGVTGEQGTTTPVENTEATSDQPAETPNNTETGSISNEDSGKTSSTLTVDTSDLGTTNTFKLNRSLPKVNARMLSVSLAAVSDVKEVHIKTQEDLDKFLAQNGTDLSKTDIYFENSEALKWPSSTFTMSPAGKNSHFYFTASSTGDIDFNGSVFAIDHGGDFQWSSMQGDHKGQTIKNAYIYGSTSNGNAAAFCWFFVRASNQTVTNMHFYNAQKMASHIMDIDGADHITIENSEFAGYGVGDISDADIAKQQTANFHNMFAEAIQIDNAKSNMNADTKTDTSDKTYQESATYITIHNNVFTNYRGKTGAAIVHNTDETVFDRYSGTGVGQHMVSDAQLAEATGIKVYNNVFFNTIPVQNPDSTDKNSMKQSPKDMHVLFYPIHEQLTKNSTTVGNHTYYMVENNAFVNLKDGNYKTQDGKEFAINSATAFMGWAGSGGAGNKSYHVDSDTLSAKAVSWNGNTPVFNTANNSFGVDNMPSDPMPSSSTNENLSHTVNRTIEYKIQGGSGQAPEAVHDSLTFNGTKTTEKYTGQSSENWDGNKDFGDVTSPTIQGYTPDRTVVSNKGVAHDAGDIYEVVTYKADDQKIHIIFHDDTDNKDIKTTDLNGESNTVAYTNDGGWHAYTTENEINAYKGQGYELVSDDTNGQQITLDHDSGADQTYVVHLKHTSFVRDATDDVPRTIEYKISGGNHQAPDSVSDSLHYTGKETVDSVNQQVIGGEWSANQDFNDVSTPEIEGYTPDRTVVSNKDVAHDAADIHEVVTYKADNQVVNIAFYDDTTGEKLQTITLNGESDTVAYTNDGGWHAYTTANNIAGYQDNGYELVSDSTNGTEIILDHVTNQDQNFEVHLKHTYTTVTEENPAEPGSAINKNQDGVKYPEGTDKASLGRNVTRTITYTMKDGSKAPETVIETLHFKQDKTIDKVTGQVVDSKWSENQDFKDVASPAVQGYTPDKATVSNKNIVYSTEDFSKTVTYTPDPQKAVVTYMDKTTGAVIKAQELNGVTNAKSGYTTAQTIQELKDNGYAFVSDDTEGKEIIYDNVDDKDQAYTVVLEHTYTTLTEDNPAEPGKAINKNQDGVKYPEGTDKAGLGKDVRRFISYSSPDGSQTPGPVDSILHFTATKVVDNVTGQVVSTEWSPAQDYDDVTSMGIKGYTPTKSIVSNKGVTYDQADITESVIYNPDAQKATITFVDSVTGKTVKVKNLDGKSNASSSYTTAKDLAALKAKGYILVSDETNGQEIVFDDEDSINQSYVVKLAHRIDDSEEKKAVTRTIKLHEPNGVTTVTQVAYSTRNVKTDAVTGKKTYGEWTQGKWKAYDTPEVPGYTATISQIAEASVDGDTKDKTIDVYYKDANGVVAGSSAANGGVAAMAGSAAAQATGLPQTGNTNFEKSSALGATLVTAAMTAAGIWKKKH